MHKGDNYLSPQEQLANGNVVPCYKNDSKNHYNLVIDNIHKFGNGQELTTAEI